MSTPINDDYYSPDVSLKKSLIEMKLIRKNKLSKTTWDQLKKDLDHEQEE